MITTSLFNYIQSELIKDGFNEFVDNAGNLIFFDNKQQFMTKIISFDDDIQKIVNQLFYGLRLKNVENDSHFKQTFLLRFLNRQINKQTIDAFQIDLMATFLLNKDFINRVYDDLEKYVSGQSESDQKNTQLNDGNTTSDNRQAYAEIPQNNVNLDVDDTVMVSASDNTINRNKQTNKQKTDGTTKTNTKNYQFDQLMKSSQIMESIFLEFDKKCFLQVW